MAEYYPKPPSPPSPPAPMPAGTIYAAPAPAQAGVTTYELTPAETEEVDRLYEKLKAEGIAEARSHVMCHTPAKYAEAMTALIDVDFPPPPPIV